MVVVGGGGTVVTHDHNTASDASDYEDDDLPGRHLVLGRMPVVVREENVSLPRHGGSGRCRYRPGSSFGYGCPVYSVPACVSS